MFDQIEPYNTKSCVDSIHRLTPRQVLVERQAHLTKQLDEVNAAITFLDNNQTFEQGFTLLQKALR